MQLHCISQRCIYLIYVEEHVVPEAVRQPRYFCVMRGQKRLLRAVDRKLA